MTTKPACPDRIEHAATLAEQSSSRQDALYERLTSERKVSIGYPCNQRFDYTPPFRFM